MSLKKNVAANFASQGWLVLMSFAFIPLYVRYLGIEAYGLIGFFVGLQAWIVVLDLGLSMTLTREMARFAAQKMELGAIRRLLASAQWLYGAIGAAVGTGLWLLSPYAASEWFHAATLSQETVETSLRLLGWTIVLRWASQLYRSSIQGLQRQVWLASFTAVASTVRNVGAVVLLAFGGATVVQFFAWQFAVGVVELALLAARLQGYLSRSRALGTAGTTAPSTTVWRFAAGVLLTNFFAVVMTQSDKLILARMLALEDFGYYTFAFTLGTAFAMFATPVFQSVTPRLTADIASGDEAQVSATYHKASQTLSAITLPAAAVVIFHAQALIYVWSGDPVLSERCASLAAIFVAAYALNTLIHVPAALALSHGWSGWGMRTNMAAAILIVPTLVVATQRFGAIGAALTNLALNVLYFTVAVYLLHRRLLRGEWRTWFVVDNLLPMLLALVCAAALGAAAPSPIARVSSAAFLVISWLAVSLVVAMSLAYPRALLAGIWTSARRHSASRSDGAS